MNKLGYEADRRVERKVCCVGEEEEEELIVDLKGKGMVWEKKKFKVKRCSLSRIITR